MANVFCVQENNRLDYAPAEAYGEVVFMTADEYNPVASSIKNKDIKADIERHMAKFDPNEDWLLMTGNPLVMGYAFHLALSKEGHVTCLQWDRFRAEYREVIFEA